MAVDIGWDFKTSDDFCHVLVDWGFQFIVLIEAF